MQHADGDRETTTEVSAPDQATSGVTKYDPSLSRVEGAVVALVGLMAAGLLASVGALGLVYSQSQATPPALVTAVAAFAVGVVVTAVGGGRLLARHYSRPDRSVRVAGRGTGKSDESTTHD